MQRFVRISLRRLPVSLLLASYLVTVKVIGDFVQPARIPVTIVAAR